jgi:hypothetical protein
VAGGGGAKPFHGAVGRTAVGDDHLDLLREILRSDARDQFVHVVGLVEHGDDDRDAADRVHGRPSLR